MSLTLVRLPDSDFQFIRSTFPDSFGYFEGTFVHVFLQVYNVLITKGYRKYVSEHGRLLQCILLLSCIVSSQ